MRRNREEKGGGEKEKEAGGELEKGRGGGRLKKDGVEEG